MSDKYHLEKHVTDLLDRCSDMIAFHASESFNIDTWNEFHDLNIKSPIEQYFYAALKAVASVNLIELADPVSIGSETYLSGLDISPQYTIHKYRVDFKVTLYSLVNSSAGVTTQHQNTVLVECDSQQWHERSERERRYEKARDRHFAGLGLHVFHYTGKEILEDPYRPAAEVIAHLTSDTLENILESVRDVLSNLPGGK